MHDFRVLGPVEVWVAGQRVDTGQPRQRAVLAALLADAGQAVPVETLIDKVWGSAPPTGVRRSLHVHITRIRRMLEQASEAGMPPAGVVLVSNGYRLDVDRAGVDLHLFRALAADARAPHCADGRRVELLRQAVGLWRGTPLAGLGGEWVEQSRVAWRQQYVDAVVLWARAELQVANPEAVLPLLTELADQDPLAEPVAAVLMRALFAAGRPAVALARYEAVRRQLAADLGADPGGELQDVYQALLRGEDPSPAPTGARAEVRVPSQLPADVPNFAGREEHLARLDDLLSGVGWPADGAATAVVISAMSGTAGVGKTALAVRWAHSAVKQFPDGQLYVNLRGYDVAGRAMSPAEAIRGFLDALGVPPDQIPSTVDAQVQRYRDILAGRRILVLLDNARDAEQVRPLLPTSATSVAVVTSRDQLTGLIVADGAHPLPLDVLTAEEARDLLARRLGAHRVDAEPAAVDEIIAACARLPLALTITAARAQQTNFPLAALAEELAVAGQRLDVLDTGDAVSQVRAVFSWSYTALSEPAAELFRLLGLHPGPDVSTAAATSLAGRSPAETRRLLGELTRANLLHEHAPGRFDFHDLLREYAADVTTSHDTEVDRAAGTARMLDHYLHSAHAADRHLDPVRAPITVELAAAADGTRPEQFAGSPAALAWMSTEHPVLLAVGRHAADTGHDVRAWQLAWALDTYLLRQGHMADLVTSWESGLRAARRLGDPTGQAIAHTNIARADIQRGRLDDVHRRLHQALDLYAGTNHWGGQADVQIDLSLLAERNGDNGGSLGHATQAEELYRRAGDRRGQARALNAVAWSHVLLDQHADAVRFTDRAIALHREIGDRSGEADTLDTLGYAHHHLGNHLRAEECYLQAIALFRELGDRYIEAFVLDHLGDTQLAAGDRGAARAAWDAALDIHLDLGNSDAAELRAKLDGLARDGEAAPG